MKDDLGIAMKHLQDGHPAPWAIFEANESLITKAIDDDAYLEKLESKFVQEISTDGDREMRNLVMMYQASDINYRMIIDAVLCDICGWSLPTLLKMADRTESGPEAPPHWIDVMVGDMPAQACSECNTFFPLAYTGGGHHYCPSCGTNMQTEVAKPFYPIRGEIQNIVESQFPLIIKEDGRFYRKFSFNIGFINPSKPNFQGDGIANDETQLDAESIEELIELFGTLLKEEGLQAPGDVKYVELASNDNFPIGETVECIKMAADPRPVPSGTKGKVVHVDDAEQIHVDWENGQSLALIPDVDTFKFIDADDEEV